MVPIQSSDKLACMFFAEFARLEYALKIAEYYRFDHRRDQLIVEWTRFAKERSVVLFFNRQHDGDLDAAIQYLLEEPPKKQIDNLRWQDCPASEEISEQLCEYTRRIRNNLFHGGKCNEDWRNRMRSEQLMRHGLTILKAFVNASPRLAEAFRASPTNYC